MGVLTTLASGARKAFGTIGRVMMRSAVNAATAAERAELRERIRTYTTNYNLLSPFSNSLNLTNETQEIRDYYLVMLAEPTIKAAFLSKIFAVASMELRIQPVSPSDGDKAIADFCHHAITRSKGGSRNVVESLCYGGLINGFSVSEKVRKIEERGRYSGKCVLRELKAKDVRNAKIQLKVDEYSNVTAIRANVNNFGTFFDPADFVVFTYLPLFGNPLGMSDFRASYRAATLKLAAIQLRMIALDKYSGPYLKGKYTSPEVKVYLETALKKARGDGFITLPDGADVEVIDLATRGTSDFQAAIDDFDKEMVIGLNGAFLHMLEGKTPDGRGSSNNAKYASELFQWYLASLVEDAINDQIIPALVTENFNGNPDLPRASLGGINSHDILGELAVDEKLHNMGAPLDMQDLYERADRIMPPDSPAILPGAPQTSTGGPAGGAGQVAAFRG